MYSVSLRSFDAKRVAIIYNPVARGLSRRLHLLQRSIESLSREGLQVHAVATEAPGSATGQTRREIEDGCDLIVAAGGDGTINEVANGMLHSGVPLAILPGGTANVLARELRIPIHLERAAAQIPNLEPCRIAAGSLRMNGSEERCFLCMAGAGLDAEIVARVDPGFKARAGKLAYYAAGFGHVFKPLREFEVRVDGKAFAASFALISRVRNYGGDLEIARGASLLRGDFEVVLFRGTQSVRYLRYFVGVSLGRATSMEGCSVLRAQSVVCEAPAGENIFVQLDGELAGSLPVAARILPEAITLLAPAASIARERVHTEVAVCA
jgi:diacylglycerol kinase (ATP)